jgi:hypothetical protein
MSTDTTVGATLYTEQEHTEIQHQLERLLRNSHFSHSKRFPSFLRFIVQEELEGRGDQLKERTLGMEVFGRDPGYDTTADPIVRVTAAEIRKRIAQYYQDCGDPDELKISLPPGSYVPHFEWPKPSSAMDAPVLQEPYLLAGVVAADPRSVEIADSLWSKTRLWPWLIVVVAAVMCGGFAGWKWMHSPPSALDNFWDPVLNSSDQLIVCFPESHFTGINLRDASDPEVQHHMEEAANGVIIDDLQPLVSLSGLLEMRHQRYLLRGEDSSTLTDLRQGPAIFLGAFDNAWTLRLTSGLRYRFGNNPEMSKFWIEDTQSPKHTQWAIDRNVQETTNNYRDYAIVARFRDSNTGQQDVVVAGIARGGTVAAGEFLTRESDIDSILAHAPKNWANMNMEFVLSTEIIDGRSSPPKVVATYFW